MDIVLSGKLIKNRDMLFDSFRNQINNSVEFSNNLDALWDVLSYIDENISIKLLNFKELKDNLGDYALKFKSLLSDLKTLDSKNKIEIID